MSIRFFDNERIKDACCSLFIVDSIDHKPTELTRPLSKLFMKYVACTVASRKNDGRWVDTRYTDEKLDGRSTKDLFHLTYIKPYECLIDGNSNEENKFLIRIQEVDQRQEIEINEKAKIEIDLEEETATKGLKAHEWCFFDKETGLKLSLFESEDEVIVAFGAFESGETEFDRDDFEGKRIAAKAQDDAIFTNLKGEDPYIYTEAVEAVQKLTQHPHFQGKKFTLCGLSLGGSLAEYVGLTLKIHAYCFNSVMLGDKLFDKTPKENRDAAHHFIHIVSVENDHVSELLDSSSLYQVASSVLPLPKHCGRRYILPSAYPYDYESKQAFAKSAHRRHALFMHSLMQHFGYPLFEDEAQDLSKSQQGDMQDPSKIKLTSNKTWHLPAGDLLPKVFSYAEIQKRMESVAELMNILKLICVLKKSIPGATEEEIQEINHALRCQINRLKEMSLGKRDFGCYDLIRSCVYIALGKNDGGGWDWPEDKILENPQLLYQIFNFEGRCQLTELAHYFEFLMQVFLLIPVVDGTPLPCSYVPGSAEELPKLDEEAMKWLAEDFSENVCNTLKFVEFKVDEKTLLPFISKLYLFLSDQLQTRFHEEMQRVTAEKEYAIVPKENLHISRFAQVQNVASKRILIVSVECAGVLEASPMAGKVRVLASGLIDRGHEVTLLMPKFDSFPQDYSGNLSKSLEPCGDCVEHLYGGFQRKDPVFEGKIGNINAVFIGNTALYGERDLYELGFDGVYSVKGDDEHATQLKERFGYFANSVSQYVMNQRAQFDAILFEGWHSALAIDLLVRRNFGCWAQGKIPALIYAFNDNTLVSQGDLDGYSWQLFPKLGLNDVKKLNVTEQSLQFADQSCTISSEYAEKVQSKESHGLEKAMIKAANLGKLTGIAHETSYKTQTDPDLIQWVDPVTKKHCPLNFGPYDDLTMAKNAIKKQLQKWLKVHHDITQKQVDVEREPIILCTGPFDAFQLDVLKLVMTMAKRSGATLIVVGGTQSDLRPLQEFAENLKNNRDDFYGKNWGGALFLPDEKNQLGLLNVEQGTEDGKIPGIGSLLKAIATVRLVFPSETSGIQQEEAWANGAIVVSDCIHSFEDGSFSKKELCNFKNFTFSCKDEWDSESKKMAIGNAVVNALCYWDEKSLEENQLLMRQIMLAAQHDQYEQVIEQAVLSSKKRIKPIDFKIFY